MAEWLKAPTLKAGVVYKSYRGFESLSLLSQSIKQTGALAKLSIDRFTRSSVLCLFEGRLKQHRDEPGSLSSLIQTSTSSREAVMSSYIGLRAFTHNALEHEKCLVKLNALELSQLVGHSLC